MMRDIPIYLWLITGIVSIIEAWGTIFVLTGLPFLLIYLGWLFKVIDPYNSPEIGVAFMILGSVGLIGHWITPSLLMIVSSTIFLLECIEDNKL